MSAPAPSLTTPLTEQQRRQYATDGYLVLPARLPTGRDSGHGARV